MNASPDQAQAGRATGESQAESDGGSLKQRAVRGSLGSAGGQLIGQGLRLASNLILTRLLFPEAFGLMALVQVVIQGLVMFSEVGIRGSIIYHERGDDPEFLNTAWSVQVLRGLWIWLAVCALAWPVSAFYEQPELRMLLPVVSLGSLIDGFASTARYTLVRRILPVRQIWFDLIGQAIALVVMVSLAFVWPSVWVLVGGNLVGALAKTLLSHKLIAGYRNRFAWDRSALSDLVRFGRWIYVSAILAFLMGQGDRLFLGKFFTAKEFGVFTVALFLSQAVVQMMEGLSSTVLQPVYAQLLKRPIEETQRQIARARKRLLLMALPPLVVLAVGGDLIVELLYDERYDDAGWMLQILAVAAVAQVIAVSAERVILASGDSFRWMLLQGWRALFLVAALSLGFYLGDTRSLLLCIVGARFLAYLPLAALLRARGVWLPGLDAAATALVGASIALGFVLRG